MEAAQMRRVIMAGIVGDAFGVPYEFKHRGTYVASEMKGFITWHEPRGSWSDDSAMSLALLDNLTESGDYAALFDKFYAYMSAGKYTPSGRAFGVGKTCIAAVKNRFINHVTPTECGDASEFANGNGALMRLAPLALVLADEKNQARRLQLTRDYTTLTHRHPRAVLGSYLYLEIMHAMLNGQALSAAVADLTTNLKPALTPDVLAEWPYYAACLTPTFGQTSRDDIKSSGYVVDTFEAALWSVTQAQSLKAAIILAANLGGDTDTVATITASLAAVRFPNDPIPWEDELMQPTYLASIIDPFVTEFGRTN